MERHTAALLAGLDSDPAFQTFAARRAVERKQEDARYLADALEILKLQKAFLIRSLVQDSTSAAAPGFLALEKQAEIVIASPDLDRAKTVMGLIDAAIEKSGLQASYALAKSAGDAPVPSMTQSSSSQAEPKGADVAGLVEGAARPSRLSETSRPPAEEPAERGRLEGSDRC